MGPARRRPRAAGRAAALAAGRGRLREVPARRDAGLAAAARAAHRDGDRRRRGAARTAARQRESHRDADGHRRALRARHPAGAGRAPHRDLPRRHATVPAGAAAARAAHAGAARLVPRPARQHDAARPRRRSLDRAHPGRRRRAARGGHGQRVGELDPHPAAARARPGARLPRRAGTRPRARGRHQRGRGGLGTGTAAHRAGAPLPAQPLHGLRPQPHGRAPVGRRRGAGGRRQLRLRGGGREAAARVTRSDAGLRDAARHAQSQGDRRGRGADHRARRPLRGDGDRGLQPAGAQPGPAVGRGDVRPLADALRAPLGGLRGQGPGGAVGPGSDARGAGRGGAGGRESCGRRATRSTTTSSHGQRRRSAARTGPGAQRTRPPPPPPPTAGACRGSTRRRRRGRSRTPR